LKGGHGGGNPSGTAAEDEEKKYIVKTKNKMRRLLTMIFLVSYYIASSQISPDFVRVVSDTLGYDSLRQVLYPSGQLFFKYLIKWES